jgi:hypothetical protein
VVDGGERKGEEDGDWAVELVCWMDEDVVLKLGMLGMEERIVRLDGS